MPSFGSRSKSRLITCDSRLQVIFNRIILNVDCTILCGNRSKEDQDEALATGHSKVKWPNSKHNKSPSLAIDAAIWNPDLPHIRWEDREQMSLFAGYALGVADAVARETLLGPNGPTWHLRWGGDWDMDGQVHDNGFDDMVHFEIREL